MLQPQNSLNSPNDSADRTADHGADGAGTSVTFVDAMSNTARYSLSVRRARNRERRRDKSACNQDLSFHQVNPLFISEPTLWLEITAIGRRASGSKVACEAP